MNDRDHEIFEHLARYRLTTREVLHRLFFEDSQINAVSKVVSRLVKSELLAPHPLDASRKYFTIGPAAASRLGLPRKWCKPLGSQALPNELGTLLFCCGGAATRRRLKVGEIAKKQPGLLGKGVDSSHYYLEENPETEQTLLGYIRVDQGGPPDHIARKCAQDIEKRTKTPALRELIESDRFVIAVVTCSEAKLEAIRENFARRQWNVRFRLEFREELASLISPLPGM